MKKAMLLQFLAPLLISTLLFGCASRPKIDWNSRIGHYTYNQAVVELGPPDKYARLNDGTVVAEWALYTSPPTYVTSGFSGYWGSGSFWGGPSMYYGYPIGPAYVRWLRLVFGPDEQLTLWRKYNR